MVIQQFVLLLLVITFILIQQAYPRTKTLTTGFMFLFLVVSAVLIVTRPSYMPDYGTYKQLFNHEVPDEYRYEPMAIFFRFLSPNFYIFLLCFAIVSISLKIKAISDLAPYPMLALVSFLCTSFVFHDMIQIRISCAIAIFLFSMRYLLKGEKIKYVLCILCATMFQYSSLAFLTLVFLCNKKINLSFWIAALIGAYVIWYLKFDIITIVSLFFPHDTYYYAEFLARNQHNPVNVFNFNQLLRIFILPVLFCSLKNDKFILLLKVYMISLIIVPLFGSTAVLAYRLSEMLGVVIIFLLPEVFYKFKNKYYGSIAFTILCMLFFAYNIFYNNYLGK